MSRITAALALLGLPLAIVGAVPTAMVAGEDGDIVALQPNAGPTWLRLRAGAGPLDRLGGSPYAGYAAASFPVRSDRPTLIVVVHDLRTTISARVLDAPPWADPRVAQPIRLEPRRAWGGAGPRLFEAAWIIAPPETPAREAFLLIEGTVPGAEIGVEFHDPRHPAPFRSLARQWGAARSVGGLASPIEQGERGAAQILWDPPDAP